MKPYAIGIDFGGTYTKMGVMHKSGRLCTESKWPTIECPKPVSFVHRLSREIAAMLTWEGIARDQIAGIGVGVPGLVDYAKGIIHSLTNVRGWNDVPVSALFTKHLGLPVFVENDANAMALGEHRYGAARGYDNVVCITLGTGVGGGLIIGGELYHGATMTAGEIGHMILDPQGPQCGCGQKGCLEAFIGTKGLLQRTRRGLRKAKKSMLARWLREGKTLTPHLLSQAARRGDKIASRVWEDAARDLGIVFAGIANLLNPDIFVVGGGIAAVGGFFLRRVEREAKSYTLSVPRKILRVVSSRLGNCAGVMGAAGVVFDRQRGS